MNRFKEFHERGENSERRDAVTHPFAILAVEGLNKSVIACRDEGRAVGLGNVEMVDCLRKKAPTTSSPLFKRRVTITCSTMLNPPPGSSPRKPTGAQLKHLYALEKGTMRA